MLTTSRKRGNQHLPDISGSKGAIHFGGDYCDIGSYAEQLESGKAILYPLHPDSARLCHRLSAVAFEKVMAAERSAHQVGFGAIVLSGCMGDKTKRHLPVALKPFNDPAMAVHELWGYSHILELGVHTYTPIGAFPAKDGDHYIFVTAKDDGLVSLDQTLWVPTSSICDEFSAEIAQKNISTVTRIAELIAYLNINGIFLPDGQIKNFVENPLELIGAIDFEKAIKVDIENVDTFDMVWENVEKLIKSLVFKTDIKAINDTPESEEPDKIFGVGMLHDMPTEQVRNFAITVIINNYLNSLDENAISMDTENAYRYADFIRKRFLERLANDNSWPSHIVRAS